jgi:hypothetical protein
VQAAQRLPAAIRTAFNIAALAMAFADGRAAIGTWSERLAHEYLATHNAHSRHVAISFEEQPAGMCLHVSVSGPWQVSSDAKNGEVAPSRAADISPTLTPDEVMRDAHRELNEALADELIQRIRSGTPAFFERLGGAPFGGDGLWRFGW